MDRYMRHFAMTEQEVITYLGALQLTTASQDGVYVVYGAPNGGPLRSRLQNIRKGTKVWVDQAGDIVLLWHCGNPVTRGPKVPLDANKPVAEPNGKPMDELKEVPLQSPVSTMAANATASMEPGVPDVPVIPENHGDIPIISSHGNLGVLGILPIIGIIKTNHHHNTSVPEPTTMAVFGIGAAALAARRRRAR